MFVAQAGGRQKESGENFFYHTTPGFCSTISAVWSLQPKGSLSRDSLLSLAKMSDHRMVSVAETEQ